jgi:hypothetical protein
MEVSQVVKMKLELQRSIEKLLNDFSKETGTCIRDIDLTKTQDFVSEYVMVSIELKL